MKVRVLAKFAPKVHIPQETWDDMMHITALVDKEVGWFTRVERSEDTFILHDVRLPTQQSSGATVEFEPEHLDNYLLELMEDSPEDFAEVNNTLRCWAHSHNNMGVSPSGQDQKTIEGLVQNCDYFVAVRVNKRGEVEADVALASLGLVCEDVPVTVGAIDMERREFWKEQVKERVKAISYASKAKPKSASIVQYSQGYAYGEQWGTSWNDDDFEAKSSNTIPSWVRAAFGRFNHLTQAARDTRENQWWAAMRKEWPATVQDARDDMRKDIKPNESLNLLVMATEEALSPADRSEAKDLMKYYTFDSMLDLIEAGWLPSRGWHHIISDYARKVREAAEDTEQKKREALDS